MVFCICSDKFVEIFADDEPFVADSFYYAWHHNNVNLFLFGQFILRFKVMLLNGVKNDLYNFFWDWEKFDTLVDEVFLKKGGKGFDLLERLSGELGEREFLDFFEELFSVGDLVEDFELVGFRLEFWKGLEFGGYQCTGFIIRRRWRFVYEDFALLNGDELGTGCVLRAVILLVFVFGLLGGWLVFSHVEFHDHF